MSSRVVVWQTRRLCGCGCVCGCECNKKINTGLYMYVRPAHTEYRLHQIIDNVRTTINTSTCNKGGGVTC